MVGIVESVGADVKNVKVGDTLTWKNAVLFVRKVRRRQAWEFHLKRRKLL
jgi:NADPH:quinone reductase-like Zn-dependent oxidoreductase